MGNFVTRSLAAGLLCALITKVAIASDHIRDLQSKAIENGKAQWGHWGTDPENYTQWGTHTNRLVPVYTFGTASEKHPSRLSDYTGRNSIFRSSAALRKTFQRLPEKSLNPDADYLDQTNIYDLQKAAILAGKKHVFLVVFDGMDWQTTQAAAIYRTKQVGYTSGRGVGLHFQDYDAGGTTEFGWMVTSPYSNSLSRDVDRQSTNLLTAQGFGGYSAELGGLFPWSSPTDINYPIGKGKLKHAYTDSASSASSMTAGIKTYNGSINMGPDGSKVTTIAHFAQNLGWKIGVVTSVPISHATPAASYSHNISRSDYQDLSRDLLGLPSINHPHILLKGVDVLIGGGAGIEKTNDPAQGSNYLPGNRYVAEKDIQAADVRTGGRYVVAQRTSGQVGKEVLTIAASDAIDQEKRLFGFFGVEGGHLPFQTADGDYEPAVGRKGSAEDYSDADVAENPTLAHCTEQALRVLSASGKPIWMMVESGDVDWANHDNNIDNSIGAVFSGEAAVKKITNWVEANSDWDESLLIVTADHGHYLVITQPDALIPR